MNLVKNGGLCAPNDSGMTLVETMIAVMVLGVFMAGVFTLAIQSRKSVNMARDHYVAVTLCKNRLETARTMGFNSLTSLRETAYICDATGGADPEGTYRRATEVTTGFLSSTNLTEVKVTVTIKDGSTGVFSNVCEIVQSIYTAE